MRGELVRALSAKPIRGPSERIRLAELTLDSDTSPTSEMLVEAADDAIALTNVTLGERLARAAVDRGGGLAAGELLARSLLWQGKSVEADLALSAYDPDTMDEAELLGWGVARMVNLQLSMGDTDASERRKALKPYQVNTTLMARAKADALFMHCLPAHLGDEVTDELIDGPQSVVFDEAENRLHAQKAILCWCFGIDRL